MKVKYAKKDLDQVNREVKDLMIKIITTKRGGTTVEGSKAASRTLNTNTGNLKRSVKPVVKPHPSGDGRLTINIEVIEYYQYLDEGTKRIKYPWFLTEELLNHIDFLKSIENLVAKGMEDAIVKVISKKN
jgi:hypothetical protein